MRWPSRSALAAFALASVATPAAAQSRPPLDSLVIRFANMSAVVGLEDAMADTVLGLLPGAVVDRAGNVVWSRGTGEPVRVALCPLDEVGYVVGAVTPEGYLTLRRAGATPMGPLFDQALEGQRVTVFGTRGAVPGVVGVRSVHLTRGRVRGPEGPFSLDDAYVDVGARDAAGVRALGIAVLSPVTRAKQAHRYGAHLVAAPDVSARAACAALLTAALGSATPAAGSGTVVAAFTRRRQLRWDGASYVVMDRARSATADDVVLLGLAAPPDSLDAGSVASGPDSVAALDGFQAVTAWSLPTRYARTPVETVSLADVTALAERLRRFLGGGR
jgi:putative aminopeptidase FrvX